MEWRIARVFPYMLNGVNGEYPFLDLFDTKADLHSMGLWVNAVYSLYSGKIT